MGVWAKSTPLRRRGQRSTKIHPPEESSGCDGVVMFTEKKAPAARYLSATGLVKSWGGHFHQKKRLRQDTYQQQGLSNPGWSFSPKKKRLRQDTYQQQGLSNSGWSFSQ